MRHLKGHFAITSHINIRGRGDTNILKGQGQNCLISNNSRVKFILFILCSEATVKNNTIFELVD